MTRRAAGAVALVLFPLTVFGAGSGTKFGDMLKSLGKQVVDEATLVQGNLLVNGDFEEPAVQAGSYTSVVTGQSFPGWEVVGVRGGSVSPISGDYQQAGIHFNAEHGRQWLDLTGPGSNSATGVQQAVRTQPGSTYEVVFYVGNVVGGAMGRQSEVELLVDGNSLGVARNDRSVAGQQGWGQFRKTFTATRDTTTVAFMNRDPANDNSNGLDNVSVTLAQAGNGAPAAAAVVLSEGFESPATTNYTVYRAGQSFRSGANEWMVESGSVDITNATVRRETAAYDGTQLVDLAGTPGPGVMSTRFATTAGTSYTVTVHYARNNGIGQAPARATVEVVGNGKLLSQELRHEAARMPFNAQQTYSGSFVADGPVATLRLASLNGGNAGLTVDGISVAAAAATAPAAGGSGVAGEYTYMGQGKASITQTGDRVHGFSTWAPAGAGPHYEFKGTVSGNTITGEWYSIKAQKGWYRWVAEILPNGDLDFAKSEDPIGANVNKAYLTRQH